MNHYQFVCPIKNAATGIEHCSDVHSKSMQGKPQVIEDKVCALAHQCWMCPFRNAVRVGGPWSHYDTKPFANAPMQPAKLSRDLVIYSLSHTTPKDSDYRRCGLWGDEVGMHDDLFDKLQARVLGEKTVKPSTPTRSASKRRRNPVSKPASQSAADTMIKSGNDMADAVNDLMAEHKASQSAPQSDETKTTLKRTRATQKKPQRSPSQATVSDKPRLSMAERAKLMKAKSA